MPVEPACAALEHHLVYHETLGNVPLWSAISYDKARCNDNKYPPARADQVPDEHGMVEQGGGEVSRMPESRRDDPDEPPEPGEHVGDADEPPSEQIRVDEPPEDLSAALVGTMANAA
jgi:hypothetical protein